METRENKALAPIIRQPKDLENASLSKAQFVEKMKKKRELAAKMREYEDKAREEVYGEVVVASVEEPEKPKNKGGRPKKDK